jgi:hypothetical protein
MLPKVQAEDQAMNLLQTAWAAQLDPLLKAALASGQVLKSISLASGDNAVNHKLGRKLQGWFPVRIRGAAVSLYDKQDTNATPALTLTLNASTAVVVDLFVF